MLQTVALVLFLLALLITGVLGTETRLLFFWPGAILLGISGLFAALRWRLRILFPPSDVCLAATLAFSAYMIGRAALSPVSAYAREDAIILLGCLVTYILTVTAASHPRWRVAWLVVLLLLVIGNLAVGSIHLSGNWGFHVVPHFLRPAEPGRIGGFFANANHLAAFLSVALFLSAGWLCFGRGGSVLKLWLAFCCVAMAVGMSLTVSRGALFGLVAGCFVFAFLSLWLIWQTQRHMFWSLLGGGIVISLLGGAVLWKVNEEYLRGRAERLTMTSDIRLGIWESAIRQNAEHPFIGAGARMFYDGGTRLRSDKLPQWAPEPLFAHNEHFQLLADYGWVGIGMLLLLILAHAMNGWRYLRWFVRERFLNSGRVLSMNLALCLGALAALAATLVHALFEFHYHVPATALTGALLLGVLANPGFEQMQRPLLRLPGVRVLTKITLGFASLALLAGAWCYGRGDMALAQAQLAEARKDAPARKAHLDEAARLDPTNGEIFYQRGLAVLDTLTDKDRAPDSPVLKQIIEDLEHAISLNPHNHLYHLALADAYDAIGRYKDALASIQRAIQLAPHHEEPRVALGIHWHRLGDWERAEAAYLWGRESWAMNQGDTANWLSSYRLMLEHAALMRTQPPAR
ncbi:MAG: O-antigen ligase family protein [Verrucomicrobiota bacterium]